VRADSNSFFVSESFARKASYKTGMNKPEATKSLLGSTADSDRIAASELPGNQGINK